MQEDVFPAAEKILSDIENILKKDSSVKTFEIIPAEDNENKSPVFQQEECLGLASWCVQPLYCYVHRRLFEHRRNKHRREDSSNVARWLLGALLLNPDVSTFWNMRRELVRSYKLDVTEELDFTRLVLYKKAKCFEAFAYRRWLLPFILDGEGKNYDPSPPMESPLCVELDITSSCADRYATNYNAFSHRRYVMSLKESRGYKYPNFEGEWKSTLAWCQSNVSDYSGFCYRQYLLEKCLLETDPNAKSNDGIFRFTKIDDYRSRVGSIMDYVDGLVVVNTDENRSTNDDTNDEDHPTTTTTRQQQQQRQGPTLRTLDLLHGKTRPCVTTTTTTTTNNNNNNNNNGSSSSSTGNTNHSSSNDTTATTTTANTSQLEPWQTCFQALSYWVEECRINEDLIRMYDDHETLWYQRRYLAHILVRLIESYNTYSYYKSEIIVDPRHRVIPNEYVNVDDITDDDSKSKIKKAAVLVEAFLNRTRDIVGLAMKRDAHEKLVVDKFLRYLNDVGLKL